MFDDAAICAIDGFGDFVSTSIAVGEGNHFDVLERVYFPHSLGMLYTAVTRQGTVFLWPVKLPRGTKKVVTWHTSATAAAKCKHNCRGSRSLFYA